MSMSQWTIAHLFQVVGYLFAVILIPRILLERRHPGATVAWLLAIGLIPFLGVPLYFLIGGQRIERIKKDKKWKSHNDIDYEHLDISDSLPPTNRMISKLLLHSGTFPPSADNTVIVIDDGVRAYNTLVNLLADARESIEVMTFILGRDEVGHALVELLAEKAKQGVQVRLLLDALGCYATKGKFVQPLRDAGGKVGIFLPLLELRRKWSANLRNHRKIAIVDNKQALVGGMNLAKEYMGPSPYEKRWKDVVMLITGNGVEHVRNIFDQDWTYSTGETFDNIRIPGNTTSLTDGGGVIQVVGDGPDLYERPLYSGVLAALSHSVESVWVVTPYFVPDEPLSAALELAARMGRDVRLIMPERSNHPLVDLAGWSFLPDLMASGVRLYRYQPGMLHAKLISIDGRLAVIGTANMDIRSFHLNFEVATFLYNPKQVQQVNRVIEKLIAKSRLTTMGEMKQKSKIRTFSEDICRVFSPLL